MKKLFAILCSVLVGMNVQAQTWTTWFKNYNTGQYYSFVPLINTNPWTSTPTVAWWQFNYQAGYYQDDSVCANGFKSNGTTQTVIPYTAGSVAPFYDGVADFMTSRTILPPTFRTNIGETVSIWFKTTTNNNDNNTAVFSMEDAANYFSLAFQNVNPDTYSPLLGAGWFETSIPVGTNWNNWVVNISTGRCTQWINGTNRFSSIVATYDPSYAQKVSLGKLTTAGRTIGYIGRVDAWAGNITDEQVSNIWLTATYPATNNNVLSVRFAETTITNTVNDSVGTKHLVINQGTANEPQPLFGGAYNFNGAQYLTNNIQNLNLGTNWTISFWANPSNTITSVQHTAMELTATNGTKSSAIFVLGGTGNSGPYSNAISVVQENGNYAGTATGTWNQNDTNAWHHVVFAYAGSTNVTIYKDSTQQVCATMTYSNTLATVSNVFIGCARQLNNLWLGGIDDIRMWDSTLIQTNVTVLYGEGRK